MAQYEYIVDSGTIVADTADIITEVENEFRQALGQTIDVDSSTPQGTLIAAEVIARTGTMKNNAELANQINPNLARDVHLDAICALMGITRGQNNATVVNGVRMTGDADTAVKAGARLRTQDGRIVTVAADFTIPTGGVYNAAAIVARDYGPVVISPQSLTILDGVVGWGTCEVITGQSTAILGSLAMNDPALKNSRTRRLATQGVGSSAAIQAAVLAVPNVSSCVVVENNEGSTGVHNGVNFTKPNAMWVCVAGTPNAEDLAMAMYKAHQGGCPWDYGTASGTPVESPNGHRIVDEVSRQPYYVKWVTAQDFDGYVHIEVAQSNTVSDPEAAVRNAILSYASGADAGELGLVVGAPYSAFEVASAVNRHIPGMYVKTCKVAIVAKGATAPVYPAGFDYEFVMAPFQKVTILSGNIQVVLV